MSMLEPEPLLQPMNRETDWINNCLTNASLPASNATSSDLIYAAGRVSLFYSVAICTCIFICLSMALAYTLMCMICCGCFDHNANKAHVPVVDDDFSTA